jgi:hypothetical protein
MAASPESVEMSKIRFFTLLEGLVSAQVGADGAKGPLVGSSASTMGAPMACRATFAAPRETADDSHYSTDASRPTIGSGYGA